MKWHMKDEVFVALSEISIKRNIEGPLPGANAIEEAKYTDSTVVGKLANKG